MLTLKHILKVGRMMEQTGRDPNFSESSVLGKDYSPESGEEAVEVKLDYECGADGDLRIVQR